MEQEKAIIQIKTLLGIKDDSKDNILQFILEDCINMALSYCHIKEVPPMMESVIIRMAVRLYRDNGYGSEDTPVTVSSVSQGSKSESYAAPNSGSDTFINSFKSRLAPFVDRRGRVPSEVKLAGHTY